MLTVEVLRGTGNNEIRAISKSRPLSIGRHASNDICIDEEDVAPIHCRVIWRINQFEVNSANRDGVDVNGTLVRQAPLRPGDVLRIGSADLVVRGEADSSSSPSGGIRSTQQRPLPSHPFEGDVPLKPVTEETEAYREGWERQSHRGGSGRRPSSSRPGMRGRSSQPGGQSAAPQKPASPTPPHASENADIDQDDSEFPLVVVPRSSTPQSGKLEKLAHRVSYKLKEGRVRPGEQEAMRSPVILGMLAGVLVLALAAAAIYFVIGRESTQQQFDAAVAEFDAKHYSQAADLFEKFTQQHSGHRLADDAHYRMWKARILREIGGSSPSWKRGLEVVANDMEVNQERKDYQAHKADLAQLVTRIAVGAARSAEVAKDDELLKVSSNAEKTFLRVANDDAARNAAQAEIAVATRSAQNAIERFRFINRQVAAIEKANAERKPMRALEERRKLLDHFTDKNGKDKSTDEREKIANNPKVVALLTKTLEVERSLVQAETLDRPSRRKEPAGPTLPSLTLAMHARSRTEEASGTRPVFVLAKGCCYGVDHATGTPLWRRVIGDKDSPFFPIETPPAGLLIFDANRESLMLLDRRSGKLTWEQPLGEPVSGLPLIDQGHIYVCAGRHLYKIDLESGQIAGRLTFSQKILGPPAILHEKERLVVPGDASLVYTLSTSPLLCLRVNDVGQSPGSIVNGALAMGSLVLLTETGKQARKSTLKIFEARDDNAWLKPLPDAEVEGRIYDAPVIYGKTLFVPSLPARITAFSVSDAPDQNALTSMPQIEVPNKEKSSRLFLSAGPEGQLWIAGSSLRRMQLKLNAQSFAVDPAEPAVGESTQPLQMVGQYLFSARRAPYAEAVFFSRIDREGMVGQWRTIFGSRVIAQTEGSSGELICATETGEIYGVGLSEIQQGGFRQNPSALLDIKEAQSPLSSCVLDRGRLAIWMGAPSPRVWIVSGGGQVASSFTPDRPLEAAPAQLDRGIILPLPGRLQLVNPANGARVVPDLPTPIGDKGVKWKDVVRLDGNNLLTVNSAGRIDRVHYQTDPTHGLIEVLSKQLGEGIKMLPAPVAGRLVYADRQGALHLLDSNSLEPLGATETAGEVSAIWSSGITVYVESKQDQMRRLSGYQVGNSLKRLFTVPLKESSIAGAPKMIRGRLLVPTLEGDLLCFSPKTGQLISKVPTGQALTAGIVDVGGHPVVLSNDGTLYLVDAALRQDTEPATRRTTE